MDSALSRQLEINRSLTETLGVLNSDLSLLETLEYIVARASEAIQADSAIIFRIPRPGQSALLEASHGLPSELSAMTTVPLIKGRTSGVSEALQRREPFPVEEFAAHIGSAIEEGRVDATAEELPWVRALPRLYSSVLAIPLVAQEDVIGGLSFFFESRRSFSEDDLRMGMALGHQVALAIKNARLRATVAEQARDVERGRIARDLHDAVTQTLFSASLIADVLPKLFERSPASVPERLEQLRRLTRGALAEMRTLLVELRPSALVDAPLGDLLRYLVDAAYGQSGIAINLTVIGQRSLPSDVQIVLYRVAQEALNNVVKHSYAENAEVALRSGESVVELSVRDDGRGFDVGLARPERFGLSIMRERSLAVGVEVEIDAAPDEGTEVRARWKAG